ncbi:cell envelope integrity protein TolA [Nitrospinaceae bacterium]|nr:cell envelope integrity protein TolA [Nitrospinaceae bacterium]
MFSVFGHLVILTIVLFLPKPLQEAKVVVPAFIVSLVETSSGNKLAAQKKTVEDRNPPIKKNKPKTKKPAVVKRVKKKQVAKKQVVKKKSPPKPNKILTALKKLDKKTVAVAPIPTKNMLEQLDQLALLEYPQKTVAKPKRKNLVLEETLRELEQVKDKKIEIRKEISPKPMPESLLEDFEELKMEEVVKQKEIKKLPDSIEEKVDGEKTAKSVTEKRNLLRELDKLAKLKLTEKNKGKEQISEVAVEEKAGKPYDSVLEKFKSLTAESSRVTVVVSGAKLEASKFQSSLRALDSPVNASSNSVEEPYVSSDREGALAADIKSLYAGLVQEKIYKNWRDPLAERHSKEAIISFHIFPKGNIDKPFIKQSSGVEVLDTLAVAAVHDSVPFPPFPKDLKMPNLFLSIYFKYVPKDN